MKTKLFAVMTLVVGLSLVGTAAADHLTKCPGTWKLVKAERDGKALPKEDIENVTLTCKAEGKDLKIVTKHGDKVVTEATAKLHKAGDEHDEYDITYTKGTNKDGDLKGKTIHGLISVDGDTMKVCWHGGKDHPHPKELHGGKDSKCTLRTFERVKKRAVVMPQRARQLESIPNASPSSAGAFPLSRRFANFHQARRRILMSVITKPAAPKKAVRELKNLRTSVSGQRLKAAFCHRCHRCH